LLSLIKYIDPGILLCAAKNKKTCCKETNNIIIISLYLFSL